MVSRNLEKYIERARELYTDDDIEVDDRDVKTSESEDGGVWVSAWLWVSDEDVPDLLNEDDKGNKLP